MVNHDLNAFDKALSAEERVIISNIATAILKKINFTLENQGILAFELDSISYLNLKDIQNFDGKLLSISKKFTIGLDQQLISSIINKQLGNNNKELNNHKIGILGEATILNFIVKITEQISIFNKNKIVLKYHQSFNEWGLNHSGTNYLCIKAKNKLENNLTVYSDVIDNNWIFEKINHLTV